MKLALLCPLACLVGLGTAVGGVKNGHDCKDESGHEGICQTSTDCPLRQLAIAGDCDQGLTCCGYVHCTGDAMTGFLCNTKKDCSELSGGTDFGGRCPGYGDGVGCCALLRGELGGAGDKVGTSSGLELVASGDLGLGLGDQSVDDGGLGLGNSGEVFPSGEFVGLGQGDEVVASNGLGFGQADGAVGLGQDDEVAAGNGLFGLRYGN